MAYETFPLRLDVHREALAALWSENMSDARIGDVVPERMRWLYERNPAGPALTWLGAVAGGEDIIGCGSVLPRQMLVEGTIVTGGVLADFAVTKAHRIAGAALAIQRALAKGSLPAGIQFLYGYPNAKSVVIFKRLGYRVVGESSLWVKPLRSAYKLRERVKNPALLRATSAVVDVGLGSADRALSLFHGAVRRARGDHRSYAVLELDRADARFDDLWQRARAGYSVIGEKSAHYLNWRYTEFTTRRHRFYCLTDRATGRLRAYVVYTTRDGTASVEDMFGEDLDTLAKPLLLRLARHLRRQGLSSLVLGYLGPETFGRHLKALGFLNRPHERSMVAYIDPNGPEDVRRLLFDKNAWFMIDGELDI